MANTTAGAAFYIGCKRPIYDLSTQGFPLDCQCNATFQADQDIAGLGVVISFVTVAWITCIVAAVASFFSLKARYHASRRSGQVHDLPAIDDKQPRHHEIPEPRIRSPTMIPTSTAGRPTTQVTQSRVEIAATHLLTCLSDLQLVTGTAIIIAGFMQLADITYYHAALISQLWNLTLNSFWAARASNREASDNGVEGSLPHIFRTLTILLGVVLAIVFQTIIVLQLSFQWDFLKSGMCFRGTQDWNAVNEAVRLVGTMIYALFLFLSLFKRMREYMAAVGDWADGKLSELRTWYEQAVEALAVRAEKSSPPGRRNHKYSLPVVVRRSAKLFRIIMQVLWCLFVQILSIWMWGSASYGVDVFVYIAFTAYFTYTIVDLKDLNQSLLIGTESHWAFGQILPLGLMGIVLVNAIDSWALSAKEVVLENIHVEESARSTK